MEEIIFSTDPVAQIILQKAYSDMAYYSDALKRSSKYMPELQKVLTDGLSAAVELWILGTRLNKERT